MLSGLSTIYDSGIKKGWPFSEVYESSRECSKL